MKHHVVSIKTYLIVISLLLALTILTVEVAKHDFGIFNNFIAFGIAFTKMLLVVTFFMHLKYSARILWICAGAGVVWLLIMISITLSDYETRSWIGNAQAWDHPNITEAVPPAKHLP